MMRALAAAVVALAALVLCLALPAQAHAMENPFKVEGGEVGTDWEYYETYMPDVSKPSETFPDVLLIKTSTPLTISMKSPGTSTTAVICVAVPKVGDAFSNASVTINNVKIDCTQGEGRTYLSPLTAQKTVVTLTLKGSNVLTAAGGNAGLFVDGSPAKDAEIIIEGDGSLEATGGVEGGAGIGTGTIYDTGTRIKKGDDLDGKITINSGTVTATGKNGAAGIGSGGLGAGIGGHINTSIAILDGKVKATGSATDAGVGGADVGGIGGAGIGAGAGGYIYSAITISVRGGEIWAEGGTGAAGIGTGQTRNPKSDTFISIYGGTLRLTPGEGSVGIGGGVSNSYGGLITIDNAYITVEGEPDKAFSKAELGTTIKGGCFGEGDVDKGTIYGFKVSSKSKVVENEDELSKEFPYCVARDGYLVLTENPDPTKDEYADQYPKVYDSKPYPATMRIETATGFKEVGLLQQASYKDSSGYSDADKVLYSYRAADGPSDSWTKWTSEKEGGLPVDAGSWIIQAKLPNSPADGNAHYYGVTRTSDTKTIKPLELGADKEDKSPTATLPSIAAGTAKSENIEITLSGGNIYDRDNTKENPFKAIATVTYPYPSNATTGTHSDATVTITALPDGCNYSLPAGGLEITGQTYTVEDKKTPTLEDFTVELPKNAAYDGSEHKATATEKDGITGMGDVTVLYTKGDAKPAADAPKDAGAYKVTLDVAEGDSYGATKLEAGTFTIAQCTLNTDVKATLPDVYTGTGTTEGTDITLSGGNIVGEETLTAKATVTHPSSATARTEPYNDAAVSQVALSDDAKANYAVADDYALSKQSYLVVAKLPTTIEDFTATTFKGEYDGGAHAASVVPNDGVGDVENVRYLKNGAVVTGELIDAGSYTLKFDARESDTHAEAKDLAVEGAVVIDQRVLDGTETAALASVKQGTTGAQNVSVTLSGGHLLEGDQLSAFASTVTYPSCGTPGPHEDATVTLDSLVDAPNYALPEGGLVLENQAYTVVAEAYAIIKGANGTWEGGSQAGLLVSADGEFDKFTGVWVDGALLDASNYTAVNGSTVVTLAPSYLATLEAGEHTLRIAFTDGAAETKFTVKAAPAPDPKPDPKPTPKPDPGSNTGGGSGAKALVSTGDFAAPLAAAVAAAAALAAVVGFVAARRAKR